MSMSIFPGYVTLREVAKRLRVEYSTAARYAAQGYLPREKEGNMIFVPEAALENFIPPMPGNPNFRKSNAKKKRR